MIWLYWIALLLSAFYAWRKGWVWTAETSRWRDLAGFIALMVSMLILASFVTLADTEVCIAAQTQELGQPAVTTPVTCE